MKRKPKLGKRIEHIRNIQFDYKYALFLKAFDEVCTTDEAGRWLPTSSDQNKEKVLALLELLNRDSIDEGEPLIPIE